MKVPTFDILEEFITPNKSNKKEDRFIPQRSTPVSTELIFWQKPESSKSHISDFSENEQSSILFTKLIQERIFEVEGQKMPRLENHLIRTSEKSQRKKTDLSKFSLKKEEGCPLNPPSMFINNKSFAELEKSVRFSRRIKKVPFKILDAPELEDDFYQVD